MTFERHRFRPVGPGGNARAPSERSEACPTRVGSGGVHRRDRPTRGVLLSEPIAEENLQPALETAHVQPSLRSASARRAPTNSMIVSLSLIFNLGVVVVQSQ
jgi:hypothetical protein